MSVQSTRHPLFLGTSATYVANAIAYPSLKPAFVGLGVAIFVWGIYLWRSAR